MTTTLANFVTDSVRFQVDQVLTADQLNQLGESLELQDRLTRTHGIGIGIITGLQVSRAAAEVRVSKGAGITSSGDLIGFDTDQVFTTARYFTDQNANYPLFPAKAKIVELTQNEKDKPLSKFLEQAQDNKHQLLPDGARISDHAVVVYLENYEFNPGICTGSSCDNRGHVLKNNLHVLLVPTQWLDKMRADFVAGHRLAAQLGDIAIPRICMTQKSVADIAGFQRLYQTAVETGISTIREQLGRLYEVCRTLISDDFPGDPNLEWQQVFRKLTEYLNTQPEYLQYYYDFCVDIRQAYDEFREAVAGVVSQGFPDHSLFPKHLMIGRFLHSGEDDPYRHGCLSAPLPQALEAVNRARFLFARLHALILNFQIPDRKAASEIKIQPDRSGPANLGDKVIPIYYQPDQKPALYKRWNYTLSQYDQADRVKSYFAGSYSDIPHVVSPLDYQSDAWGFYRIEGHLGQSAKEVLADLKAMISERQLPFQVILVQVDEDHAQVVLPDLDRFHDLFHMRDVKTLELAHQVKNVQSYTQSLKGVIETLPQNAAVETNRLYQTAIAGLSEQVMTACNSLHLALSEPAIPYSQISQHYTTMQSAIADAGKSIQGLTQSSAATPIDILANDDRMVALDRLNDLLDHHHGQLKRRYVLSKFILAHPGLTHLSGVPAGGTFVLVSTVGQEKVIADFALPYWYTEKPLSLEPPKIKPAEPWKIGWGDRQKLRLKDELAINWADKYTDLGHTVTLLRDKVSEMEIANTLTRTNVKELTDQFALKLQAAVNPADRFADSEQLALSDTLENLSKVLELYDNKAKNGTITEAEKAARDQTETAMVSLTESAIQKVAQKGDVAVSSADAVFADKVLSVTSERMSVTGKSALSERLNVLSSEKPVLKSMTERYGYR